jgi:tRNA pseudouridine65 synthase
LQFERNEIDKRYVAVVRGWPPQAGVIDHPLSRQFDDYGRRFSAESAGAALPAMTEYCRLASADFPVALDRHPTSRYALMMLTPRTGRQHQLRRHLKHVAHPIIGDTTWGKGLHNRFFQERFGCQRLLLACVRLGLRHPVDGSPLSIAAPLDDTFGAVLTALGWSDVSARLPSESHMHDPPGTPSAAPRRE